MKRIFSFALGNIWRWSTSTNRDDLIKYIRGLNISGVELTLAKKEELYSFCLSDQNKQWLRNIYYVTIHAPFRIYEDSDSEKEVIRQIDIISKIYRDINCKNVVIHPEKELLKSNLFGDLEFEISVENLPQKNNVSISDLQEIFQKHPQMKFCLDTSHAYSWSKFETGKLIDAFHDRISQIHLSGSYRKKDHQSLRKVAKEFLFSIKPTKQLEVPIVIEEDMEVKSLRYVNEEIVHIKNLFPVIEPKGTKNTKIAPRDQI